MMGNTDKRVTESKTRRKVKHYIVHRPSRKTEQNNVWYKICLIISKRGKARVKLIICMVNKSKWIWRYGLAWSNISTETSDILRKRAVSPHHREHRTAGSQTQQHKGNATHEEPSFRCMHVDCKQIEILLFGDEKFSHHGFSIGN
jgi:hypothetical protein